MVSESHIYLTRCRSCCRRSSLCCAERASRLWVPASQDEGSKQETLRWRRERDRSELRCNPRMDRGHSCNRYGKNTGSDWFMYTCLGRPTHALLYIGLARAETYGTEALSLVPRPIFHFVTDPEELLCVWSSYFNQQCHSQLAVNESKD